MAEHYLDDSITQPFWDNAVTPRLSIDPGDTVVIECAEPVGQMTPDSSADDLANLDFSKVHALTGSIHINGAAAGDTLEVEILDMRHKGWGWTGHIPGFGLLQEDFDFAYIHHWELTAKFATSGCTASHCPSSPSPAASAWRRPKAVASIPSRPASTAAMSMSAIWSSARPSGCPCWRMARSSRPATAIARRDKAKSVVPPSNLP